ncbi:FtsX-like permease family protein [Candidatus Kaiserbacteria bacterium]|nr:FtsX-like permease family protein [Candidatus Kaiserbacteria bacterium]NCT01958.1 FtsX-like permease family protein [Candidatus Parcubacteria bacterium]
MRSLRIGLLLGLRQIQRASIWTTVLIIFVMMLTFLNLIAVSGILVGLIAGSERAVQEKTIGDIIITPLDAEDKILQTETVRRTLTTIPEISAFSVRYKQGIKIEANYKTRRDLNAEANIVGSQAVGFNPFEEDTVTTLSENIIEGEYFEPNESGYIILGALNLERYTAGFADITGGLKEVYPGDTVRVTIGQASREFIVKGIINAKAGGVANSVYLPEQELRRLIGSPDRNANEIIIRLTDSTPVEALAVKDILVSLGLSEFAKIRTFEEALPKFITDIKNTFNILGTFIGSIGIVVASITIFIIIFINALSRRRHIGILKGIGIERSVIEIAYVSQAAFYALTGSFLGALLTYSFLVPYFDNNPIQFPFSDGILSADPESTFYKFVTLFIITLFAGFVPAWMIAKQNTLNAILGRK